MCIREQEKRERERMEHVVIITHRQHSGEAKLHILGLLGTFCVERHAASLNLRFHSAAAAVPHATYNNVCLSEALFC